MDFNFLPDEVKKKLAEIVGNKLPVSIVRANGNLEGKPGEGYVIIFDDRTIAVNRGMGESEYVFSSALYGSPDFEVNLKKDKFNSLLSLKFGDKIYTAKISSFEEKDARPLLDKISAPKKNSKISSQESETKSISQTQKEEDTITDTSSVLQTAQGREEITEEKGHFSPLVSMAAALMFVAASDKEIASAEDVYIRKVCADNQKLLQTGLYIFHNYTFDEFLDGVKLDHVQALCILANMMEVGMSDGVLHSCEQNMIHKFARACNIPEEEYQTVKDVMIIKNQISVLCTNDA